MIKKQFTLYMENRPGALAEATRALADEGVNLEGISVSESTDVALVQIVVSNAEKTRHALKTIGIPFTEQNVALLCLANSPGALSEAAARLARHGVNINYIYATACECKTACRCYVVVSAPDLRKVIEIWNGAAG